MRHRLLLDYPDADGHTLREHLQAVADNHGIYDPQLDPPQGGDEGDYLLEIFWSVNSQSHDGKITSTSLLDWCRLHGEELTVWEVETIEILDGVFQRFVSDRMRKEVSSSRKSSNSRQ